MCSCLAFSMRYRLNKEKKLCISASKTYTHCVERVEVDSSRSKPELTFFCNGSLTSATIRFSSLRIAFAATPVVALLKSCKWVESFSARPQLY